MEACAVVKLTVSDLAELLSRKNFILYVAESCTGGLICSEFTKLSGISACFGGGVVAYSNEYKIRFLGVSPETLDLYGAVSASVAEEMAAGVILRGDVDGKNYIGLSVTGVAGPSHSENKPVGLVYFGLSINGTVRSFERHFAGSRNEIQRAALSEAVSLMYRFVSGE